MPRRRLSIISSTGILPGGAGELPLCRRFATKCPGETPKRPNRQDACATNSLSPCMRTERLITVPTHYGFFPSRGCRGCCAVHSPVVHILRKTSHRAVARRSAGAAGSGKKNGRGGKKRFLTILPQTSTRRPSRRSTLGKRRNG